MYIRLLFSLSAVMVFCAVGCAQSMTRFDFGAGRAASGHSKVTAANVYSKESSYGFEPGANVTCSATGGKTGSGYCTSGKPFYFSAAMPEGNYRVTVTFGSKNEISVT